MSRLLAPARLAGQLLAGAGERFAPKADSAPAQDKLKPGSPIRGDWFTGQAQQLWCEPGKHHWARVAAPGRKPTACPEHR